MSGEAVQSLSGAAWCVSGFLSDYSWCGPTAEMAESHCQESPNEPIHGGCFEILKNKQNPKLNGVYSKILSPASPPTPHAAAQHLCSGSGNSSAFFCPQSFPLFVKGFEMLGWGKSCSLLIADVNKEPDGPCRP